MRKNNYHSYRAKPHRKCGRSASIISIECSGKCKINSVSVASARNAFPMNDTNESFIAAGVLHQFIIHSENNFLFNHSDTLTKPIKTGTSTSGPTTVANATGELIPKTAIATAMASSKLLPDAVNAKVAERA